MSPGRFPKHLLYGKLASGKRKTGRPCLGFKDVCQRDMIEVKISIEDWESQADDRSAWRAVVMEGVKLAEERRVEVLE